MELSKKKQSILKPVLSEKSLKEYSVNKYCTFWVDPKATKAQIKSEFKSIFGIEPVSVRTVVSRKTLKHRTISKISLNRKYVKKAYVNIGQNTLDIFENIS